MAVSRSVFFVSLFCALNILACVSTMYVDSLTNQSTSEPMPLLQTPSTPAFEADQSDRLNGIDVDVQVGVQELKARGLPRIESLKRVVNPQPVLHSGEDESILDKDSSLDSSHLVYYMNDYCQFEESVNRVVCTGVKTRAHLPESVEYFRNYAELLLVNCSMRGESGDLQISHLRHVFPSVSTLTFKGCGSLSLEDFFPKEENDTDFQEFSWDTVKIVNLTGNQLTSGTLPLLVLKSFPELTHLDLSRNNFTDLSQISPELWNGLKEIDISENPLDCTLDLDWIESSTLNLINVNKTVCDRPPHQNKPKQILKVYPLVKKVREECRLNCSCYVDYIWEQGKVVRGRTTVNCTNRGLTKFPDPDTMPHPTSTLDLSFNKIESLDDFALDPRFEKLNVMNLYLNDNKIKALIPLETSDWFYQFQTLNLRNNNISRVPMYALENLIKQNERLYFIDLSRNNWNCDCQTVSTFKLWLLRNSKNIRHVDDVRCEGTQEQIRHMAMEDWCKPEQGPPLIDVLDLVSLGFAFLIIVIVCKVYYDYRRYNFEGRLPWLARKL